MGSAAHSLTPFTLELVARCPACIPWTGCSLPVSGDQPVVPQPRGMLPCLLLSWALKKVGKTFRKNLAGRRANLRNPLVRHKTRHLMMLRCHFSRVQLFATQCSPPGSSVGGVLQARTLEWVAMPSSRRCSRPRD